MEQEASISELRDRAASSEPSSTRPNPFDDGDFARKRRRTSLTGSGSPVESRGSQARDDTDPSMMNVDAPDPEPDPATPSTPPHAQPPQETTKSEPRSSKVTLNLRNAESLEATPLSPTPSRPRRDDVKSSVERSEADMAPIVVSDDDSSANGTDGPVVVDLLDDDDEDEILASPPGGLTYMDLNSLLLMFPYRGGDETVLDVCNRLVHFIETQQPAALDEVLGKLSEWLEKVLGAVEFNHRPVVLQCFVDNRAFWTLFPQVFWQIYLKRSSLLSRRDCREIAPVVFSLAIKLVGHVVALDHWTLQQLSANPDLPSMEIFSTQYLNFVTSVVRTEEKNLYNGHTPETTPEFSDILELFQMSIGGTMQTLLGIVQMHSELLSRFPRKTMELMPQTCHAALLLARESVQELAYHQVGDGKVTGEKHRKNITLGLALFQSASRTLETAVDKHAKYLTIDSTGQLLNYLSQLINLLLQSKEEEVIALLEARERALPGVPKQFIPDVIGNEWRFGLLSCMIRSRQMQLRVASVGILCTDLVTLWKRFSEIGDDGPHHDYLHYVSEFLTGTKLVDYLFGPTCHPEITQESSNIVGFLMVTKTYSTAHTDLFWQTVTSSQDPRVAEAVARMMSKIVNLMTAESLSYLCEKMCTLPMDGFVAYMRELCDNLIKALQGRPGLGVGPQSILPYRLCVRLLQQSSAPSANGITPNLDIHSFAAQKLKDLLVYANGPIRAELRQDCLDDITAKTPTTSGSLHALCILLRPPMLQGMNDLIQQHNFARILVEEIASSTMIARGFGVSPVYAAPMSTARRDLVRQIITNHGDSLDSQLGRQLWDLLVGSGAACQEDRVVAWQCLNTAAIESGFNGNPFLSTCLRDYLPDLSPRFYCDGALNFVRAALAPLMADADANSFLDDEDTVATGALELLWQMILASPHQSIESQAIRTLVDDVYVESEVMKSFPVTRARNVHFGLLNRCLRQMESAAERLRSLGHGTRDGDGSKLTSKDDSLQREQLKFTRSLAVLRAFLKALQGKYEFASPDLRPMMPASASAVEGDSAELKYQSFDGDIQTDIQPLLIGRNNTVASLLASLRDATGFDNYRIFYRGSAFTPTEDDVCKSIEDLTICDGLILVKKEEGLPSSCVKVKPGASKLEIEVLGHFDALWEYLSLDESLAEEIYYFLVSLPAHESIQAFFEDDKASYQDVFPVRQPFKSLYAIYALRDYLATKPLKSQVMHVGVPDIASKYEAAQGQEKAVVKTINFLVAAIRDPAVVGQCSTESLRLWLTFSLMDNFVQLIQESTSSASIATIFDADLQSRLFEILTSALSSQRLPRSIEVVCRTFEALLEGCSRNADFWLLFTEAAATRDIVQTLLFADDRAPLRAMTSKLVVDKTTYSTTASIVQPGAFAEFFWLAIFDMMPDAIGVPSKCKEVFTCGFILLRQLADAKSPALDVSACLNQCGQFLLAHTTVEDASQHDQMDVVSHGLITFLNFCVKYAQARGQSFQVPTNFAVKLARKHLFPPEDIDGPLVPQVLVHTNTRALLCSAILVLIRNFPTQHAALLHELNALVPYQKHTEDPYKYDLPLGFDRSKAIRAPCGYSGLRNLSNTCYLNSLFTQLFMNPQFRRFVLQTPASNSDDKALLFETRHLFAGLQDSVRRFVDPHLCVGQILNYDESPIDIHNQMDVDEFYNLLFDRWESQLSSNDAKKTLRAIYGGQLVQQVKSKECEHISERMEPFSAIQCDIKGKAGLEESLLAYVDGEIMEGDNKYKCETCDRHVDAVKRTCLKDVPDNLIFHLKRFDFNLRTLQRSKINDKFAFPAKINMQPYNISHLSDPSSSVGLDEFELVGVLVHSGTAESGHYYSFIRERPSSSNDQSWVEFNDDVVTAWDPAQMEDACFGGPSNRPYDSNGLYDKVYSAYMLFYQRSSSLRKEQEALRESGGLSPLRFRLPTDLEPGVKEENWAIIQRHCLNDPSHFDFVFRVLQFTWGPKCSDEHKMESLAMQVALGHLDQVVARARDVPDFEPLHKLLAAMCRRCARCCFTLYTYFRDCPVALKMLLQKNSDLAVRQKTGELFIQAICQIKEASPVDYGIAFDDQSAWRKGSPGEESVLEGAVVVFDWLYGSFHLGISIRSWPECFGVMVEFAALGPAEAAALLSKDFLWRAMMIVAADASNDPPQQYARMLAAISRRMATRPPSYDQVIALIDVLLRSMTDVLNPLHIVDEPSGRLGNALKNQKIPFTEREVLLLDGGWERGDGNTFIDKLLLLNQHPQATDSIIVRLMGLSVRMEDSIVHSLRCAISGQIVGHQVSPFLRAAVSYVQHSTRAERIQQVLRHIAAQCWNMQGSEGKAFFAFFQDTFAESYDSDTSRMQQIAFLPEWAPGLLGYHDHHVRNAVEGFLQEHLFEHEPVPGFEDDEIDDNVSRARISAGRHLAIACLTYLQDMYVARRVQAPRSTVSALERVIKQCTEYFRIVLDDGLDAKFAQLSQDVLEPIGRLTVDEIEDDNSDWGSVASSDQMGSIADFSSNAQGDLHDAEMP